MGGKEPLSIPLLRSNCTKCVTRGLEGPWALCPVIALSAGGGGVQGPVQACMLSMSGLAFPNCELGIQHTHARTHAHAHTRAHTYITRAVHEDAHSHKF